MAKVWVLDTSTKGTGAQMVPLEKVLKKRAPSNERIFVPRKPPAKDKPSEPRPPRKFKVVDVMTEQVLAEDATTRATVELLEGIRSVVDVRIYVWEPKGERWRPLTLGERQMMWDFRGRR
jgi:hypothetical protein